MSESTDLQHADCSAVLLAVHQVDEDLWQSMVVVEHQTIGFGPVCESEEECQWWCSQFKAAMSKAGARFMAVDVEWVACQSCGEVIEEEAVHINGKWWQCQDCHEIEFGSPPIPAILSLPGPPRSE